MTCLHFAYETKKKICTEARTYISIDPSLCAQRAFVTATGPKQTPWALNEVSLILRTFLATWHVEKENRPSLSPVIRFGCEVKHDLL